MLQCTSLPVEMWWESVTETSYFKLRILYYINLLSYNLSFRSWIFLLVYINIIRCRQSYSPPLFDRYSTAIRVIDRYSPGISEPVSSTVSGTNNIVYLQRISVTGQHLEYSCLFTAKGWFSDHSILVIKCLQLILFGKIACFVCNKCSANASFFAVFILFV